MLKPVSSFLKGCEGWVTQLGQQLRELIDLLALLFLKMTRGSGVLKFTAVPFVNTDSHIRLFGELHHRQLFFHFLITFDFC